MQNVIIKLLMSHSQQEQGRAVTWKQSNSNHFQVFEWILWHSTLLREWQGEL